MRPERDSNSSNVNNNVGDVNSKGNEGSENGSVHEEEYTTALPSFPTAAPEKIKDKERKERGLRGVLPFQRKKKDKDRSDKDHHSSKDDKKDRDKDRDKDREKEKEREKEDRKSKHRARDERGILDLVEKERRGEYGMGSLRRKEGRDKDEEF